METKVLNSCVVCTEKSEQVALHYTRILCNGCRAFFKRTVQGKVKIAECKAGGQCVVDPSTRKLCKACRFESCQRAGVDSTKVQQPKEENTDVNDMNQQYGHAINVNSHTMPSTSSGVQSAFHPYYFTSQPTPTATQNICAVPPLFNVHHPSLPLGLFNQNLTTNFGGHQVGNSHLFTSSQLPVHSTSSGCSNAVPSSSMQIWTPTLGIGYLPAGFSSMESNNRATASSSTYADMANYLSNIGSSLMYNPNPPSTSQQSALSYVDLFQQSASALANYASVSGARSLASAWSDRRNLNGLDTNIAPLHSLDNAQTSKTDIYSVSNTRQDIIRSLINAVPLSAETQTQDSKPDIVGIYQRDRCNTHTSSVVMKREVDYTCDNSHFWTVNQQNVDTLDKPSTGHRLQFEKDLQHYPVQHERQQFALGTSYLLERSPKDSKGVPSVQLSGKSSAFMIDMLLKPQQKMWPEEDERVRHVSGHCNTQSLSLDRWQDHTSAEEITESYVQDQHFREKASKFSCKKADNDDSELAESDVVKTAHQPDSIVYGDNVNVCSDIYTCSNSVQNDEDRLVRRSAPNYPACEPSFDDTLEYVDVHNTDEDIRLNDFKSRHLKPAETADPRKPNPRSVEEAPKGANKELTENICYSDNERTAKNTMSQKINSLIALNQSHGVSNGDSGFGRSNHVSSSDLQQNRPASVDNVKAAGSEPGEVHRINKENVYVTPARCKRRLSLSEESNTCAAKKIKLNNHSLAATACSRISLGDISQNYIYRRENSPRKRLVHLAASSESSSEDEATAKNAKIRPKYTSTPIVEAKVNKSRVFLEIICDFAKYCQLDEKSTYEEDADTRPKNLSSSSFRSKDKSSSTDFSEDSFQQQNSSESQTMKWERLERFQDNLMKKVRSLDSYTMAEFKTDAVKLNSLAQDAVRCGQLKF